MNMDGNAINQKEKQRVASLSTDAMRPEWLDILARIPGDGLKGEGFPRNVLGVIMHNSETFGPFLNYWVVSKLELGLTVREQELVILRMAVLYKSNYVWKHHVKVGREFGVTDDELTALRDGGDFSSFSVQRERSFLCLTDEVVEHRTIRSEMWEKHSQILKPKDIVDLIHLTSQYTLFATMNNAMQVAIEPAVDVLPGIEDDISSDLSRRVSDI
eukprot:g15057.t1 g15057   contig21:458202-458973(-)